MSFETVFIGNNKLEHIHKPVQGNIVNIDGEKYFKISNYDQMPPFFMNIVSDSDLWMFISSNGALTAGRKNPDNALFPYYTDDRIHDSRDITGNKTLIIVTRDEKSFLWEPFSALYHGIYQTEYNIYKNMVGNQLIFEHVNHDLAITFSYSWMNCDRFGFVKKSQIKNLGSNTRDISVLDGILNILPFGADRKFQLEYSNLLDAYKKNELIDDSTLALYTLSSIPTDRAEPSEALKATTVWSTGLDQPVILLSAKQIERFRNGGNVDTETSVKAQRGAYLVQSQFELLAARERSWYIVADLGKDQADVALLNHFLQDGQNLVQILENEINRGTEKLKIMVARADGLQLGNDQLVTFRHFSNTLFNIMRGGIFDNNYRIDSTDFRAFIAQSSNHISQQYNSVLQTLNGNLNSDDLPGRINDKDDPALEKLCLEYLPITFGRRHGDPSRPWNTFSIDIKDEQGERVLNYQGNWRDIFQNWEALSFSFPGYIEKMIAKFINASTADGYNPYRVTRDGFEWEVLDPNDNWSYIGYWGDHQIVYLERLLQVSQRYHPHALSSLLGRDIFTYANVPYRIKPYMEMVRDPHNTIDFDHEKQAMIQKRIDQAGNDGKYVWDESGQVSFVNLAEKLLLTMLVKLTNFVPQAGIWMNTQRPEWNDANNALVGYGTSMVTCYYLKKYITLCLALFQTGKAKYRFSTPVATLFHDIEQGLQAHRNLLQGEMSAMDRKKILNVLGKAGTVHRNQIYEQGIPSERTEIATDGLIAFMKLALEYVDHSIAANRRNDGLYHAYNLIKFDNDDGIVIRHLYEMLEGQVAVLSSGYLSIPESLELLDALKSGPLYRKDQFSYLLYPERQLAQFIGKNIIPTGLWEQSELLTTMLENDDRTLVIKDLDGQAHFNGRFRNASILKQALMELNGAGSKEEQKVLDIYEQVFDHQSFTGRSGTFFKYEGLGSIYWHMVSKLLLAVQETLYRALDENVPVAMIDQLKAHYDHIQQGIGVHKRPDLYGAFPTDPYSHTPANSGVQQPGMTGQVKEDMIARFGELGLQVRDGKISFNTRLFNREEYITKSQVFEYFDVNGKRQTLMLNPGMLAYTVCQVPVIYIQAEMNKIVITGPDDEEKVIEGFELDLEMSESIFQRRDKVKRIQVLIK